MLSVCVFLAALAFGLANAPLPRIGDPAPRAFGDESNEDVRTGRAVTVNGKIAVIEFFATWCAPCRRSLMDTTAVITALSKDEAAHVVLIVVDVGESAVDLRHFLEDAKMPAWIAVVRDERREAFAAWGARRLPTVFVLDGHGTIRHINRGHGEGYRARIEGWLKSRLDAF